MRDNPEIAAAVTPRTMAVLAAIAGLLTVVVVYWPGLAGPFLFDDIGAIADLGRYGGIDDWQSFSQFVFGGNTGPTGRPISLLSFLIDGSNWPTDPWPFKRTNLVIHVANACLVGAFCRQALLIVGSDRNRVAGIAIVAALCWALHPFLVSTVLYPVQRMAQLAAFFVLAGMNLYAWGRPRVATHGPRAYAAMTAATAVCSVLAVASKENGALLPVLVAVFELTVVASARERVPAMNRIWAALFLWLPALLVIGYLLRLLFVVDLFAQQARRGFSMYERLLTESRIVADYLRHLLLPSLFTSGIFQDDIQKSTGLLQPVTTLVSAGFHVLVIATGWLIRRRLPLLAFAVLFFYAGHLVESTVVSLELYFEHRNYLPAAFLFLPVVAAVAERVPGRAAVAAGLLVLVVLAGFTRYSASIWSDYDSIVEASAAIAPESSRAQQQYSMLLFNRGQYDAALDVSAQALARRPTAQDLNVWHALILCRTGRLSQQQFDRHVDAITGQPYDLRALTLYETLAETLASGSCPTVGPDSFRLLLDRLLADPVNSDPARPQFAQLAYLKGLSFLLAGDADDAGAAFEASLESRAGVGRAMKMAALFAGAGAYEQALHFSDIAIGYFRDDGSMVGEATGVTRADVEDFRVRVRAELAKRAVEDEAHKPSDNAEA